MLVNATGDIAANDMELYPARKHMINFAQFRSAVHMLLAEWTSVPNPTKMMNMGFSIYLGTTI